MIWHMLDVHTAEMVVEAKHAKAKVAEEEESESEATNFRFSGGRGVSTCTPGRRMRTPSSHHRP